MARRGKNAPLSEQEILFVREYVFDNNATRAYIKVYGEEASYDKTRRAAASVRTKANVASEIQSRQAEMAKRLRVSPTRLQKILAAVAFSDISDILDFANEDGRIRLKPGRDIPLAARQSITSVKVKRSVERTDVVDEAGKPIYQPVEVIEFKLADKLNAIDKLYKQLGLYRELPPLEAILAALPPAVADQVRRALAEAVLEHGHSGSPPSERPEPPAGPSGHPPALDGPHDTIPGGELDPGPVATGVPPGPQFPEDAPVLPPSGEDHGGGGPDPDPLFDPA